MLRYNFINFFHLGAVHGVIRSNIKDLSIVLTIVIFAIIIHTAESIASWDCFRTLHKQAISDALNISPTDLKNSLASHENYMLKEVDVIHNTSKPDRKSFTSYYKDIVEVAKDCDPKRYEYMARLMTHITVYFFDLYCPIKTRYCDENQILKQTSVIYDGCNLNPDYSKISQLKFEETRITEIKAEVQPMIVFYNKLVNEIVDLWVTIWKDAKRDISGLPKENALVRGIDATKEEKKETVTNSKSQNKTIKDSGVEKAKIKVLMDDDLQKYKYETDGSTYLYNQKMGIDKNIRNSEEDRRRLNAIGIKIQEIKIEMDKDELAGRPTSERLTDELRLLRIEMDQIILNQMERQSK